VFVLAAKATDGSNQHLSSLSAKIDNYAAAYIVPFTNAAFGGGPGTFAIVPKTDPTAVTVNVTVSSKSLNGTALPDLVISADLAANAPVPPQAAILSVASVMVGNNVSIAPDPGVDTITIPVL